MQKLLEDYTIVVSKAVAEPIEKDEKEVEDKEADVGGGLLH